MQRALALCAVFASAASASTAGAAEDEVVLAFEPAYTLLTGATDLHGAGGHLTAGYGLTDELWLTASLGGSRQLGRMEVPGRTLLEGFAGLTAAIDVLRAVPFVEVLIGVVGARLAERTKLDPTVRLGVGLDVFITPSFTLGAAYRFRPVSDDLGDSYMSVDLRLAWRVEL